MKKSFLRSGRPFLSNARPSLSRGRKAALATGLVLGGAVLTQGCLQRDVNPQKPNTSNVFVEQIANSKISEIDLLFVIDNSVSMADKQEILKKAVPQMVQRLVNPLCVDSSGENPEVNVGGDKDSCPDGKSPEFEAINDIHIGVISSSLGGHGSDNCKPGMADPKSPSGFYDADDKGHLIPTVRSNVVDKGERGLGFLAWGGGGEAEREALITSFEEHVEKTGENGCGFEAPLEAWYRFLVDPEPPINMVLDEKGRAFSEGPDTDVLNQRAAFLRPEGLVAIVLLTDENDCSAMDGGSYYNNAGFGYLIAKTTQSATNNNPYLLPVATAMCASNPNDKCCFSCLQSGSPPKGCEAEAAVCGPTLPQEQDRANVRCFNNKLRFGVDLLYPTQRYVDALTKSQIVNARTSQMADNPLLRGAGDNAGKPRDPGLVFLAGIVGIPWQDVATPESLTDANTMRYLTAAELSLKNVQAGDRMADRWEVILGQPGLAASSKRCDKAEPECGQVPVPPLDPFMIESIEPRPTGAVNPIVPGEMIVEYTSNDPQANNINGHEVNHSVGEVNYDDLQYACIFPLESPKMGCTPDQGNCDCGTDLERNRPLCQPPGGGPPENNQYWGKAYPGTRILQVLKDFGANSIVGSICPKITTGTETAAGFGYNPAVQAIVDRLAEKLTGKCLPRELSIDEETGEVPCSVVEAKPKGSDNPLDCSMARGRDVVDDLTREAVVAQLKATGRCDGDSLTLCADWEMCVIDELSGGDAGRDDCLYNQGDEGSLPNPGFCYIDPAKRNSEGAYIAGGGDDGQNPLVANCPATERRLLRFVGANTPAANTITFVACTGEAASEDAPIPAAPDAAPAEDGEGM